LFNVGPSTRQKFGINVRVLIVELSSRPWMI